MFRSFGDGVSNVYGGMSRGLNNVGSGLSSVATKVYGTLPSMPGTGVSQDYRRPGEADRQSDGLVSTMGSTAKSMASNAMSHIREGSKSALSYVPRLGGLGVSLRSFPPGKADHQGGGGRGEVVAVEPGT